MAGATQSFELGEAVLQQMADRLADPRQLVARLGEYLVESTKVRFASQTAPDGSPWAKLKPSYARRKKYNKDKILTLRGYLRRFQRHQVDNDGSVLVGTDRKYGALHQFGGTIEHKARAARVRLRTVAGRTLFAKRSAKRARDVDVTIPAHKVTVPARPFLGVSAEDEAQIALRVAEWLTRR